MLLIYVILILPSMSNIEEYNKTLIDTNKMLPL